jgi:ribosomal protein S18 acetylase RimI-like enzyme
MMVRKAHTGDIGGIVATDHVAGVDVERLQFIRESLESASVYVATIEEEIVGYCVFDHSFFSRGFISLLIVHPEHRRKGIGSELVRHVEHLCESERLFTSTNQSNKPMQSLLRKMGYKRSGVVDDLDPGDPEVFFSKKVK